MRKRDSFVYLHLVQSSPGNLRDCSRFASWIQGISVEERGSVQRLGSRISDTALLWEARLFIRTRFYVLGCAAGEHLLAGNRLFQASLRRHSASIPRKSLHVCLNALSYLHILSPCLEFTTRFKRKIAMKIIKGKI